MTGSYIVAILLASVAEFVVGAIWYMPLFGNLWGKIHGFDKQPKATQKEMQASMMPFLVGQFLVTLVTTVVLAKLIMMLPSYNPYTLAVTSWIGFVVPTQVSAVIFGGTEGKWVTTKIAVMAFGSLACLLTAVFVLGFWT